MTVRMALRFAFWRLAHRLVNRLPYAPDTVRFEVDWNDDDATMSILAHYMALANRMEPTTGPPQTSTPNGGATFTVTNNWISPPNL